MAVSELSTSTQRRFKAEAPVVSFVKEALKSQKFDDYFSDSISHIFLDEKSDEYVFVVVATPAHSSNKDSVSLQDLTQVPQKQSRLRENVKVNRFYENGYYIIACC